MNNCEVIRSTNEEVNKKGRNALPCYRRNNRFRLFILIKINGSSQPIHVFQSPDRIMLFLQVRIIVNRLDIWVISQSREECPPANIQAPHCLDCAKHFIVTLFHFWFPFRTLPLYPIDIQYVKSYDMYRFTRKPICVILLRTLYTKITESGNCRQGEDNFVLDLYSSRSKGQPSPLCGNKQQCSRAFSPACEMQQCEQGQERMDTRFSGSFTCSYTEHYHYWAILRRSSTSRVSINKTIPQIRCTTNEPRWSTKQGYSSYHGLDKRTHLRTEADPRDQSTTPKTGTTTIGSTRRGRQKTGCLQIYRTEVYQSGKVGRCQSRWPMASKTRGARPLCSQKHQTRRRQKINAGFPRHLNNSVAANSPLMDWKPLQE
jgi:hypothetical protein